MTDIAGFDVCMAIGAPGLGQALQSRIQPLARPALLGMLLPLPNAPSSTLDVNIAFPANSSIDGVQHRVTITATGSGDLRMGVNGTSLVTLPGGISVPGALASVPISVSIPTINVPLTLTITRAGTQIVIDQAQVTVTTPGFPGPTFSSDLQTQLTTQLNAILAGTGGTVQAAQVTATVNALVAATPGAVTGIVQRRLQGLFPLPIDFSLPAVDPNAYCNIGLRDVEVALLNGSATTAPCLAIATKLLSGSSGNIGALASPLPTGQDAGLFFDNTFLVQAVCCGVRHMPQFGGLPAPTGPTATDQCCHWNGINVDSTINGNLFHVRDASVCLDSTDPANKRFVIGLHLTTSGTGWDADVNATIPVHLSIQSGSVVPVVEQPTVNVDVSLAWWVIVIEVILGAVLALVLGAIGALVGAIVGAIVGGIAVGAIVGAGIGAVIGIILAIALAIAINDAIRSGIANTLRGAIGTVAGGLAALKVIPDELQDAFGRLVPVTFHFDDLRVLGHQIVDPPADERTLIDVRDIVLNVGEGIDLDRAAVVNPSDPGCDLTWRVLHIIRPPILEAAAIRPIGLPNGIPLPVPTEPPKLEAKLPAGLQVIAGRTYAGVHLANVRALPFGAGGGFVFATAVPTDVQEPLRPLVFGVHTGEGRYAKGAVWQESNGKLHLRYALWDSLAAVRLVQRWVSQRGAQVPSLIPFRTVYQVARTGTIQAVSDTLRPPIAYSWVWNGAPLPAGSSGPLPGGIQRVDVSGDTCVIHTDFGVALQGELCVEARDVFNVRADLCRQLNEPGTEVVSQVPVVSAERLPDPIALWKAVHGGDPAELLTAAAAAATPVAEAPSLHTQIQAKLAELGAAGPG